MTNDNIKKIENDTEVDRMLNKFLANETHVRRYVEAGEDKTCLPDAYIDSEEKIKKFQVKDDDCYVIAHPKTGTTWCQEMVWLINNDLDYETAKTEYIIKRFPILEASIYGDPIDDTFKMWKDLDLFMLFEYMPSPRCFKSHLPWSLLPEQIKNGTKKPKIVSIIRKPHDTCVSYYHHLKKYGLVATLDEFGELFMSGRLVGGPFDKSVLSFWEKRDLPNVLILNFHELKTDLQGAIKKVADFLEKTLTDEQVEQLADYLQFDNMKKNPSSNCLGLIRKGEVGSYKKEMSEELIEKFDEWEKEKFKDTDIVFE